jgi:hypothetical protein
MGPDRVSQARRRPVLRAALIVAASLAFAAPASASAATIYASPSGAPSDPCTQASPCDIVTAVDNTAVSADTAAGSQAPGSGL